MSLDSALPVFLTEATELLERMEMSLVELARSGSTPELINDIFRAAHKISVPDPRGPLIIRPYFDQSCDDCWRCPEPRGVPQV